VSEGDATALKEAFNVKPSVTSAETSSSAPPKRSRCSAKQQSSAAAG
jgi:hypothetical protein